MPGQALMKALVLHDYGRFSVEEIPVPPVGPGEVLIRVYACGICGTDLKIIEGAYRGVWPEAFPFVLGHEWAGVVEAVGDGVRSLRVGDRVVGENHQGCGECPMCRQGRYNLCEARGPGERGHIVYGHNAPGAFAEYITRPEVLVHPIPDHVSFVEGALVNQAATAAHGVRRARVALGETVLVIGPGLMGLLSLQIAKAAGAARVVLVGRGARLQLARELGADVCLDRESPTLVDDIRAATGGRGPDVVLECAGTPAAVQLAATAVRRGGRVALLGLTGKRPVELITDRWVLDEIDVVGVRSSPNAYPAAIQLIASRRIQVGPLATHTYPLEAFDKALETFRDKRSGALRIIVTV